MSLNDIRASIDIGSNSILLLVAELSDDGIEILESESRITSLGFKLDDSKEFHPDSMDVSMIALNEFKDICSSHGIEARRILVTATEASRVATNAKAFYNKIYEQLELKVNIITPDAEAYYSAKGILFNAKLEDEFVYALDVGGASSEVIKIETSESELVTSFSLPFGGVRASDWLIKKSFDEEIETIKLQYKDQILNNFTRRVVCVGGTITSLACIIKGFNEFSEEKINKTVIHISKLQETYNVLKELDDVSLLEKYPFLGKRSKSIVGGLRVIMTVLNWLKCSELEVSTYGLRYGTLMDGEIRDEYIA